MKVGTDTVEKEERSKKRDRAQGKERKDKTREAEEQEKSGEEQAEEGMEGKGLRGGGRSPLSEQLGSLNPNQWAAFGPYPQKEEIKSCLSPSVNNIIITHMSSVFTAMTLFVPIPIVAADFRMEQ